MLCNQNSFNPIVDKKIKYNIDITNDFQDVIKELDTRITDHYDIFP